MRVPTLQHNFGYGPVLRFIKELPNLLSHAHLTPPPRTLTPLHIPYSLLLFATPTSPLIFISSGKKKSPTLLDNSPTTGRCDECITPAIFFGQIEPYLARRRAQDELLYDASICSITYRCASQSPANIRSLQVSVSHHAFTWPAGGLAHIWRYQSHHEWVLRRRVISKYVFLSFHWFFVSRPCLMISYGACYGTAGFVPLLRPVKMGEERSRRKLCDTGGNLSSISLIVSQTHHVKKIHTL